MFKRIMLWSKVNEFYRVCGAYLYNAPAHTTMRDINDDNFLSDVLYDINEMCDNAPNDNACAWLTKLDRDIRTHMECKTTTAYKVLTAVLAVLILWVCLSTIEVMVKNNSNHPEYSSANLWEMLFETEELVHTRYTAKGRYYTNGTVITEDGNEWSYSTEAISDKPTYDGMPVDVGIDDNGTPDDISDDIILGLVWDINTSVYDELESELSDAFEIEREGNNIRIKGRK